MLKLSFEDFSSKGSSDKLNYKITEARVHELNLSESNKRVLVLALSGVDNNYNGRVKLNDIDLKQDREVLAYLEKHTLFVTNKECYFENLTVYENLKIISLLWSGRNIANAVATALGMEDVLYEKVKNLTAEEKRVLSISKIACCPSYLWVIDSKVFKLDGENKISDKFMKMINNVINVRVKEGGAVIML